MRKVLETGIKKRRLRNLNMDKYFRTSNDKRSKVKSKIKSIRVDSIDENLWLILEKVELGE